MPISKGHLPYRGEPQPKLPKRRRQIRDLKTERRKASTTIFLIVFVGLLISGFAIFISADSTTEFLQRGLIVLVFLLPLVFAINSGFKSVNKFRKGYDIDISGESESENSKQPEDLTE
jgi:hypothetical protein